MRIISTKKYLLLIYKRIKNDALSIINLQNLYFTVALVKKTCAGLCRHSRNLAAADIAIGIKITPFLIHWIDGELLRFRPAC